jgi:hypothetical protein
VLMYTKNPASKANQSQVAVASTKSLVLHMPEASVQLPCLNCGFANSCTYSNSKFELMIVKITYIVLQHAALLSSSIARKKRGKTVKCGHYFIDGVRRP